ncbi:MAG TPA: DUF4007 family protein [Pyrinomonadaceae bacterium]|jgi:hypothetical protein
MQTVTVGFSGHETFPFRYGWLKKGVDAVAQNTEFFSSERAMIDLGVGKNMVTSIKHWCTASGLIKPKRLPNNSRLHYSPTPFGKALIGDGGFDPFLEDTASLWLLHWQLAFNRDQCTTWHWLFNSLRSVEFTKEIIFSGIQDWLEQIGKKATAEKLLKRDIDVCLRTYVHSKQSKGAITEETFDCPLTELGLIIEIEDGKTYQFQRGEQETLPNEIFLFALSEYWRKYNSAANSLSLGKIINDEGSPGRIFKIDENSAVRRLEQIEEFSDGAFAYAESAGLKEIFRHKDLSDFVWLEHYYQKRSL